MPVETPLLDKVTLPSDLRKLERSQLRQLADELRAETIDAVSTTGGHLGSGLGVVELTVALHYIFNTPDDRIVWDVGHQCYPHKILTGRRDRIRTLRQGGVFQGSPSGQRANTTRLALRTPRRRFPPHSDLRGRGIISARKIMRSL